MMAIHHYLQVLDTPMVEAALDGAEKRWGGPVNVVVNCAGILLAQRVVSKKGAHPLESFLKVRGRERERVRG